jgi:hypothetical protein
MRSIKNLYVFFLCFSMAAMHIAAAGELKIVSHTPVGSTSSMRDELAISVTFDSPMVPLQAVPEDQSTEPLSIKPEVKGTYHWLGSKTLVFVPEDTLPLATEYTVTVPAGVASLDGGVLSAPFSWTFESFRPRFLQSVPADGYRWLDPLGPILLKFNQPVSPARVRDFIRLSQQGVKGAIPIRIDYPDSADLKDNWRLGEDKVFILKIVPEKPLSKGTATTLVLQKGLLAKEGNLGLDEEKTIQFQTYGPLKYTGLARFEEKLAAINPQAGVTLIFTNRVSPSELVKNIRFEPLVVFPDFYETRTWGSQQVHLAVELKPETGYRFTLSPDLMDIYDNRLGLAVVDSFRTGPYPERISFTTGPGVLEAYGDRKFPITVVNKEVVDLRMGVIPPNDLVPLLAGEQDIFQRTEAMPESLVTFAQKWKIFAKRNTRQVRPIEVDWALKDRQTGLVLIEIKDREEYRQNRRHRIPRARRIETKEQDERNEIVYRRALLQTTNMGVSAKFSPFNNVIWVTSLKDASPVKDARIEIRDDQNRVCWTGTTNAFGIAETPGWRELGIKSVNQWEKPGQWIFVYWDEDFAYTASDWGTGIYPYRFGIDYDWNPEPVKTGGVVFTDRGLYRAGETVCIKGIMRRKDVEQWQVMKDKELQLCVRDARGEQIHSASVTSSEFGAFHCDVPLAQSASLGYYWVSVETLAVKDDANSNITVLSGDFRVEAFRPAEFKVDVHPLQQDAVLGDLVQSAIQAAYLFGSPMAGGKLFWHFLLNPINYVPKGWDAYLFGPLRWGPSEEKPFTQNLLAKGESDLDEQGHALVAAKVDVDNVDFPLNLAISAEVESPSRQRIAGFATLVVHPAHFYIGIQPSTTFTRTDEEVGYKVVAVSPDGVIVPNQQIHLTILHRQWHSVRKAGLGGRYQWMSKYVDTAVDSLVLVSEEKPLAKTFIPQKAGLYFIRAEGTEERATSPGNGRMTIFSSWWQMPNPMRRAIPRRSWSNHHSNPPKRWSPWSAKASYRIEPPHWRVAHRL